MSVSNYQNYISILNLEACKKKIEEASSPEQKFKAFESIAEEGLHSASFQVLQTVANDPRISDHVDKPYFTFGTAGGKYIALAEKIIANCVKLSEVFLASLGPDGKRQLQSRCGQIDTYIENKMFQVLKEIITSKNFTNSDCSGHPLYSLNKIMWDFQNYNHGNTCPCNGTNPIADLPAAKACIVVKCDTGFGNKLFIRGAGPGLSWDRGIELKNNGGDTWIFEIHHDFSNFEFKILWNDRVWETGSNHSVEKDGRLEIAPKFGFVA